MINIFVPKIKKVLELRDNIEITKSNCYSLNPYILTNTNNFSNIYYDSNFFRSQGTELYAKRNFFAYVNSVISPTSKTVSNILFVGLTDFELGYSTFTGNYKFGNISVPNQYITFPFNMIEPLRTEQTLTLFFNIPDDLVIRETKTTIIQISTTI